MSTGRPGGEEGGHPGQTAFRRCPVLVISSPEGCGVDGQTSTCLISSSLVHRHAQHPSAPIAIESTEAGAQPSRKKEDPSETQRKDSARKTIGKEDGEGEERIGVRGLARGRTDLRAL
uniref:Uncharacterized protein n=1 Tax=Knipowitschia caucasica TaxID=637954 RepID=A0AAV2KDT7_KNICA